MSELTWEEWAEKEAGYDPSLALWAASREEEGHQTIITHTEIKKEEAMTQTTPTTTSITTTETKKEDNMTQTHPLSFTTILPTQFFKLQTKKYGEVFAYCTKATHCFDSNGGFFSLFEAEVSPNDEEKGVPAHLAISVNFYVDDDDEHEFYKRGYELLFVEPEDIS